MAPYRFRVFHMSTWIHSGANRTPPLDVPFEKRCDSPMCFLRVHSMFIGHFDLEIYLYSTTYIPLPPSHTTHSVAQTSPCRMFRQTFKMFGSQDDGRSESR